MNLTKRIGTGIGAAATAVLHGLLEVIDNNLYDEPEPEEGQP